MSAKIEKSMLLRNRNENAKIGPFDGLAGCVVQSGELFITSTNKKFIPQPPLGSRPLQLRNDCLYGEDDPIIWPQPFNRNFPHYSCIPRHTLQRTEQIMWWKPTQDRFTPSSNSIVPVVGLGKLDITYCHQFEQHVNALISRVEEYLRKTPPARVPPFLGPMVQMVKHSLSRVKSVAMSFNQMEFQVRDIQRSWLEVTAMLDYMEIYRPRMDGTGGSMLAEAPATAKTIGTFTSDLRVAQDHFQAGLPFWLIRPANAFSEENILQVCEPRIPQYIDMTVHRFRRQVLADGRAGTDIKYNAIHGRARNFMRYPNPFDSAATVNIGTASGPSTSSPSNVTPPSTSAGPVRQKSEHGRARSGQGSANNNRGRSTQPKPFNVHAHPGRNKFEAIESPFMPSSIPSWRDALKSVDTSPSRLDPSKGSNPHDGKYLLPEPGIFVSVTNAGRQARYFETWKSTRAVCIHRIFQASSKPIPLSGQDWRNFLLGNLHGAFKGPRNQEMQERIRNIFANCLDDLHLDFETLMPSTDSPPTILPDEAQNLLWELAELNFRFELLALDKRASQLVDEQEIQDRQTVISRGFPGSDALIVANPSYGAQGLASSDWRERLPFLLQLRNLMRSWKGHKPTPLLLPDLADVDMYREDEVQNLEDAITLYYTQTFFNFFGRAAIIPMRLHSS